MEMKKDSELEEEKRSRKAFAFLIKMAKSKGALISVTGWDEKDKRLSEPQKRTVQPPKKIEIIQQNLNF